MAGVYPSAVTHYQVSFAPVTLAGGHVSGQQVSSGLSGGSSPAQQHDMCPPPPSSCELLVPAEEQCGRGHGDASQTASAGLQGDHATVVPQNSMQGCLGSSPPGQWLNARLKAPCARWVPTVWSLGRAGTNDVCPPLLLMGLYFCTKTP